MNKAPLCFQYEINNNNAFKKHCLRRYNSLLLVLALALVLALVLWHTYGLVRTFDSTSDSTQFRLCILSLGSLLLSGKKQDFWLRSMDNILSLSLTLLFNLSALRG
ncbi:hypothetical protein K501DRAFT_278773 [Backusella circina FSU 941]|nr:hypothetical protein K501DRAFT_278773 [Backusella circina FSU 941]